jgi:3-hydroxyisobutyrate dehydrogenase-like beta-hydroxyacid dehydrogenase
MTADPHTARVGFIGLGDQGAPMAQAIGDSGFGLHVWARRPQSLDVLARTRHTVHDSAASLAAAVDILELCLRDDRDIWEVLGIPGVEDALRPGLIVASHGTGDPGENREIAGHLAGKRVAYLDAPVSGGGAGARARTLTTMAGGDRTAYQKCEDPALGTSAGELARAGIHSHRPSPALRRVSAISHGAGTHRDQEARQTRYPKDSAAANVHTASRQEPHFNCLAA